ncbi:hypothetical protein [Streptomyces xanthochromogenes]|uniref:hypothetical protein n=1 Tax=Streptomyces xanthochromogenes TaxID=67384 RepID=UPI003804B306
MGAFAVALTALRDEAGAAGGMRRTCDAANISRSTYYAWLSGKQLPGRDVLEIVVKAWGGNVAEWIKLRRETEEQLAEGPDEEPMGGESELFQKKFKNAVYNSHAEFSGDHAARLRECAVFLRLLGLNQVSDRRMLVVLSLLMLGPATPWQDAGRPVLRVSEIMQWISDVYGRKYRSNSREVIREDIKILMGDGLVRLRASNRDLGPKEEARYQADLAMYRYARGFDDRTSLR